jgi:hypothetical protein
LRQPGTDLQNPKADLEALVVSYLADPQVKLPARATAAWALGMIKPGPRPADLNFPLMAYLIGAVAAEVGTQIVALDVDPVKYPEQLAPYLDKVRRQTDLLLQLYQGFEGDPSLRDAGLLRFDHPSLARHRQMVANTAAQVRAVIAAAVALTQSAGSLVAERRAELARAVAELKAFLAQSRPDDLALYPGGPQFTVPRFEAPGGPSGRAGGRRTSAGR